MRDHELKLALHAQLLLNLEHEVFPGGKSVHEHQLTAWVERLPSIECLSDNVVGGHHDKDYAAKSPEELFLSNLHRLFELNVLSFGFWSVPLGVHAGYARTQTRLHRILHVWGFAHATVHCVDLQDQLLVQLLVHLLKYGTLKCHIPVVLDGIRDDLPSVVFVDEAGAAQLGDVRV